MPLPMTLKISRKVTVSLAASILALLQPSIARSADFTESGGVVFFEAESAVHNAPGGAVTDWSVRDELPNFSGGSYIEWTGPDFFDSSNAGQGLLTYSFEIINAGNYELRWRTRIAKGDSNTESNDSWVRFPSGVNIVGEQPMFGWTKVFMGHFGAWFWDAKMVDHTGANVRQYFSAGTHTMEVSGRSYGHAIDKIALYKVDELSLSPFDLDSITGTPQATIDANQLDVQNSASGEGNSGNTSTDQGSANDQGAATEVPAGVRYTPGECVDDRLALPAIADIHVIESKVFNDPVLQLAPEPAQSLMRFDLAGVTALTSAELQVTIVSGGGAARVVTSLADATAWQEYASGLAQNPASVLQLNSSTNVWNSGARYAIPLPASDLPTAELVLSVDAVDAPQQLQIASREESTEMPLLIVGGDSGFCDNYLAAVVPDEPDETVDTQPVAPDDAQEPARPDNGQANQGASSGGGSGGSVSIWFWLCLPLFSLMAKAKSARGIRRCS